MIKLPRWRTPRRDYRYDPTQGDPACRSLFEPLQAECGAHYQIGVRVEDDERWRAAGVLNQASGVAVKRHLREQGLTRRKALTPADIATIRAYLTSDAAQDLVLSTTLGGEVWSDTTAFWLNEEHALPRGHSGRDPRGLAQTRRGVPVSPTEFA